MKPSISLINFYNTLFIMRSKVSPKDQVQPEQTSASKLVLSRSVQRDMKTTFRQSKCSEDSIYFPELVSQQIKKSRQVLHFASQTSKKSTLLQPKLGGNIIELGRAIKSSLKLSESQHSDLKILNSKGVSF